jgi:hypothetical protein
LGLRTAAPPFSYFFYVITEVYPHTPLVQRWPVEQALHTPPPVPQLAVLIPLWQLPLESTHPPQD